MPPRTAAPKQEAEQATLQKLAARFDVEDHKTNPRGFTYIAIEKVVNRFNEVLGASWDVKVDETTFQPLPGITFGARNPKPAAISLVTVTISALIEGRLVERSGVGGDFGAVEDADKLIKTAYAEAIKKAGHEFGVGLYLWDEEERALIAAAQQAGMTGQVTAAQTAAPTPVAPAPPVPAAQVTGDGDLTDLKNKVADLAVLAGVQRTGPAISSHFGITIEQLQDEAVLRGIIAAQVVA